MKIKCGENKVRHRLNLTQGKFNWVSLCSVDMALYEQYHNSEYRICYLNCSGIEYILNLFIWVSISGLVV